VAFSSKISLLLDQYLSDNFGSIETDGGKNINRHKLLASGNRNFSFHLRVHL
jgi:hypothetical protein